MNPEQGIQKILASHNYKPPAAAAGKASGWYDQIAKAQTPAPKEPNLGQRTAEEYLAGGDKMVASVKEGADKFAKAPTVAGKTGALLETGLGTASGAVQTLFAPITAATKEIADKTGIHPLKALEGTELGKNLEAWANAHPDAAKNLGDIVNVLGAATGAKVAPGVEASDAVTTIKSAAEDAVSKAREVETTAKNQAAEAAKAKQASDVKTVASEWKKPTTVNKASYNKARSVLERDPEIPQFLSENGIHPRDVIEDGKYNTHDTSDALRATAAKMSVDTLRPSLKMADYSTPKTSVDTLAQDAIKRVGGDKYITEGDKASIIKNITKESEALKEKYPDGMSLTEMHDSKITYAQNGGYSPIKSASDNNTATANRNLASAFQKAVEDSAPEGVDVSGFNDYLQKFYRAADYLDELNTKVAPPSTVQEMARGAAKYAGAALGAHFGGGVVSAFAGYQIGKALEHAIENLGSGARANFLKNLQISNPEAFTKVEEYLKKQGTGENGMLALPAASPTTPIPLGTSEARDSVTSVPAAKAALPVPDPKTGKMMRVYTQEAKKI